jgi:hypothetical protein
MGNRESSNGNENHSIRDKWCSKCCVQQHIACKPPPKVQPLHHASTAVEPKVQMLKAFDCLHPGYGMHAPRSACRQGKVDEEVLRRMVAALLAWSFTPGSQGVGSPPGSSQQGEQQEGRMDGVQAAEGPHKALPGWLVEDAQNIQQVADGVGVAAEARAL